MKETIPRILLYVAVGVLVSVLSFVIKLGLEYFVVGKWAEREAFQLLQGTLSQIPKEAELPVVVYDTSGLPEVSEREVIDFKKLTETIRSIANLQPSAIAIDLTLTPEARPDTAEELNATTFKGDEEYFKFLDFCLVTSKTNEVPIFVAVGDRSSEPDVGGWLGDEKYDKLAVTRAIPHESRDRGIIWLRASNSEKLYSIGAALAKSHRGAQFEKSLSAFVETVDDEFPGTRKYVKDRVEYAEALVGYSKLDAIKLGKLPTVPPEGIRSFDQQLNQRMVILGDDERGHTYSVEGKGNVPEVYIHAATAYTFANEPMLELKPWPRFILDIVPALLIVIGPVAIVRAFRRKQETPFNWRPLQWGLVAFSLLLMSALAFLGIRYVGIVWLDFLLVSIGLLIHPIFARKINPGE